MSFSPWFRSIKHSAAAGRNELIRRGFRGSEQILSSLIELNSGAIRGQFLSSPALKQSLFTKLVILRALGHALLA